MKEMLHYLKPYWRGLLTATIAVAISTVCDLLLPAIMSEILNKGVYRADFAYIVRCCAIMAAVALVGLGTVLLGSKISNDVVASFCADLRAAVFRKVNQMSFEEFGELGTAALVTRCSHDVETVSWIAAELSGADLIDINMGCPAPKITGNGEGSALMKEPLTAARVIEAVVKASDLPVSVKFRKGWDSGHVNCVDFARMAEASGAAFVTIHGRTRDQMYSGAADWEVIAEAKAALSIPVIGNGDVTGGSSAIAMRDYTGCDGIMIARGALGNPYVFQEVKAAFAGVPYTPPSNAERLDLAIAHVRGLVDHKGPHGVIEMRKHIAYYVRGMKGASAFRTAATLAPTAEALIEMIEEYKSSLE